MLAEGGIVLVPARSGRPTRNTCNDIYFWAAVETKLALGHFVRGASQRVARDARSYTKKFYPQHIGRVYSGERIRHLHADVKKLRGRSPLMKKFTDKLLSDVMELRCANQNVNIFELIACVRATPIPARIFEEMVRTTPVGGAARAAWPSAHDQAAASS